MATIVHTENVGRRIPNDDDVELALALACELLEMTREAIIRLIIREWLEEYGFLPVQELDEASDTEGSA
ncbi:hypothetical protein [Sinorhizobium fredii]|uniref:Ribbon-helix-helix protein CopG domain-containing protein n=2 Tax=Rhizobium fredii TaxID=380 RepID=A0A2A6LV49_RHIFR|nr:hypothetical protein [Sinorhizobium fredii]KSV92658.1 hypothetical protein N181_00960 [Sinorhizobium fredii USDA 205]MQW96339.1 hypothetical protein [Sinorhizobium fredii]MQX10831.1 hypothetical protein [Sinorhizobium fredii]PDT46009.1 hypothetical protein CO661_20370 [Sinorhizobium fredii]UTY48104.1 hypothetical protein EPK84_15665 [Sinorhizobium fredii]